MEEKKTDRRISRTRRQLRDSLLGLIPEKGYEGVTIEDITERADLGRTTFYLHYKDKDELLIEIINVLVDDLVRQVNEVPILSWKLVESLGENGKVPVTPILLIFQHAARHAAVYHLIQRGVGSIDVMSRLREVVTHQVIGFIEDKEAHEGLKLNMGVPREYFANYFSGALLGIITWWLDSDLPYSTEEVTVMFQRMFFLGAAAMLGLGQE
jgi:AcrR family transcriptional regulator